METQHLDRFKAQLEARLLELDDLAETGARAAEAVELDQTSVGRVSRIDAIQNQAMAIRQQENRRNERERIEAALKRIEEGAFGRCLECDGDIALKRLAFDPALPTCIACAK
ncbi:MAG: TraR/DksA family transcriptional regulator [Pseudomonadota bacterium]